MDRKLINILIGSIYFLMATVAFAAQRIICEMYQANTYMGHLDGFHNLGGLLFNWYSDLVLLLLATVFFGVGIYFTFFRSRKKPK